MPWSSLCSAFIRSISLEDIFSIFSFICDLEFMDNAARLVVERLVNFMETNIEDVVAAECCVLLQKLFTKFHNINFSDIAKLQLIVIKVLCGTNVVLLDKSTSLVLKMAEHRKVETLTHC